MDANGAPSSTYPAFPVDVAQVVNHGGSVLNAPTIVTITWSTDPNVQTYQALGDAIGSSQYWSAINSEYGVGPARSGAANDVIIATAPPSSFNDGNDGEQPRIAHGKGTSKGKVARGGADGARSRTIQPRSAIAVRRPSSGPAHAAP